MNFKSMRGRIAVGTGFLTVLALTPVAGKAVPPNPTVAEAVSRALVAASGSTIASSDDSTATGCMTSSPQPLAYRTDRVVLSTWMDETKAGDTVRQALSDLNVPSDITGTETISLNDLPGAEGVAPIISVSFWPRTVEQVPIVRLTRHLRLKGVQASPDYLLSPSSGPSEFWPNGGPVPTTTPPPARDPGIGAGISIFLYDTGLVSAADGNIPPNVNRLTQNDNEAVDSRAPFGVVDLGSAGHTVAIAGVINAVAPGAVVEAARITDASGVATDVSAARRMANTLRQANRSTTFPGIIVNAFGSAACDGGPMLPGVEMAPLGLRMVADAVDKNDRAVVVASAGNRSSNRRFYPAAFSTVLSVGALDATLDAGSVDAWTSLSRSAPKADFSNYGPWVKAWTPGVQLSTNHLKGYRFELGGPVIDGLAFVQGTSFSGPMTAGLMAELMAAHGWDADTAWEELLRSGVTCSQAIGSGVAIALTSLTSAADDRAPAGSPVEC
jgi:hypothetical protein